MAILLITHDLTIVRNVADRVFVMNDGEIVENGATATLYADPRHPCTRMLLAAEPTARPPPADHGAAEVMGADDLRVWFPIQRGVLRRTIGHVKAVDGVTVCVREGQTVGVVGESGSGKTTLGMALLRLIASDGPIRFEGRAIDGLGSRDLRAFRSEMQVVFQDPYSSLSPRLSVFQIVEEGMLVHGVGATYDQRRALVAGALHEVGIEPGTMDRYPHEFLGRPAPADRDRAGPGAAAEVPRAGRADQRPRHDRPGPDRGTSCGPCRRRHRLAYLFISHDLRVVRALANEVIVLRAGRVVEQGPAQSVFENPGSDYTRALMAAAFEIRAVEG